MVDESRKSAKISKKARKGKSAASIGADPPSGMDVDEVPIDAEDMGPAGGAGHQLTAAEYSSLSELDHIKQRPNIHIGSIVSEEAVDGVLTFQADPKKSAKKLLSLEDRTLRVVPGFQKLAREVFENAFDAGLRDDSVTQVTIELRDDSYVVENNGMGITTERHATTGKVVVSMVFFDLRTSSNYTSDRGESIGQNGLGVKLVSAFAKRVKVTNCDQARKMRFVQESRDGLTHVTEPKISPLPEKKHGSVRVEVWPELTRFFGESTSTIPQDELMALERAALDMAADSRLRVVLVRKWGGKDERVVLSPYVKKFADYAKLILGSDAPMHVLEQDNGLKAAFSATSGEPRLVSLANGARTSQGGSHLDSALHRAVELMKESVSSGRSTRKSSKLSKREMPYFEFTMVVCPIRISNTHGYACLIQ